MKNAGLVPWCGPGKRLQTADPQRRHEAIAIGGEERIALHFGADGLPVIVVEHQAVDVVGEVFEVSGYSRLRIEILAADCNDVDAALFYANGLSGLRAFFHFLVEST